MRGVVVVVDSLLAAAALDLFVLRLSGVAPSAGDALQLTDTDILTLSVLAAGHGLHVSNRGKDTEALKHSTFCRGAPDNA